MKADKPASKQSSQSDRFVATARELGADEDEERFREKLARIARQKPKDDPKATEKPLKNAAD